MTNLRKSKLLVLIFTLLPIVQSCAGMKSRISPKSSVKASAPVKDFSQTTNHTSGQAVDLAKEHIKAGDWQKAIDVYNVEYRKHPHDQALLGEYVKTIENIKSFADKALDKKDFASAGRKYDVLMKNYENLKGFDKKLSFNSTHLNEKLYYCKQGLFKKGFQEYRQDNIGGAIAIWQDLFAMDPQNEDIKELLRTAQLQQKNLQEQD
jgi:tetratricopeptide (TPR) repeat protein